MNIKTSNLTGPALDWAVAKCEGRPYSYTLNDIKGEPPLVVRAFEPSTSWQEGGPIIERECICLTHPKYDCWTAIGQDGTDLDTPLYQEDGPTPLIAAMRCYVASQLGDEVDVPEELV